MQNALHYFPMTRSGVIRNACAASKVAVALRKAIKEIQSIITLRYNDKIESIYLRGSVPAGYYRPKASDLDILIIFKKKFYGSAEPFSHSLSERYARYFSKIDMVAISRDQIYQRPFYQFQLSTQALKIYGTKMKLPVSFKACSEICFTLHSLKNNLDYISTALKREPASPLLCQWVMKVILRSAFELTIPFHKKYSRDLYTCYATFARYYPVQKKLLYQCFRLAIKPTADKKEILKLIESTGYLIVKKYDRSMTKVGCHYSVM